MAARPCSSPALVKTVRQALPSLTNELVDPRFERVGNIPDDGNIDQFDEGRYSGELGGGQDQIVRRSERRQRKAEGVHRQVVQIGDGLKLPTKAQVGQKTLQPRVFLHHHLQDNRAHDEMANRFRPMLLFAREDALKLGDRRVGGIGRNPAHGRSHCDFFGALAACDFGVRN